MNREINIIQKQIRAEVIRDYLLSIGQSSCVCFTCGNASKHLQAIGLDVKSIIKPAHWWEFDEIQRNFKRFDATSGHLPMPLMYKISERMAQNKQIQRLINNDIELATGSGETFVTLSMAFPFVRITPVYNLDAATEFNAKAPLNTLVDAIYKRNQTNKPITCGVCVKKGICGEYDTGWRGGCNSFKLKI